MSAVRDVLQAHGDRDLILEYERERSDALLVAAYVFLDARPDSQEYAVARRIVLRAASECCAACGDSALLRHDGCFIYETPDEKIEVKLCAACWFSGEDGHAWHERIRQQIAERREYHG